MHYAIDYSKIKNAKLKDAQGLLDMREYVGEELWAKFAKLFIQPGRKIAGYAQKKELLQSLRYAGVMVGVQGFPIRAYYRAVVELHK